MKYISWGRIARRFILDYIFRTHLNVKVPKNPENQKTPIFRSIISREPNPLGTWDLYTRCTTPRTRDTGGKSEIVPELFACRAENT